MQRITLTLVLALATGMAAAVECDSKLGQTAFENKCAMCHDTAANQHSVGPNLRGMLGRPIGRVAGYAFSEALGAVEGKWTEQRINTALINWMNAFPGSSMAFQGLKAESERNNLICFLKTLN